MIASCLVAFSAPGKDTLRGFPGAFPFSTAVLEGNDFFVLVELLLFRALLVSLFCPFLGPVDSEDNLLSHGRAAIHRSFQLQPQSAFPSSEASEP